MRTEASNQTAVCLFANVKKYVVGTKDLMLRCTGEAGRGQHGGGEWELGA